MPSPPPADRSPAQPPRRGAVDALISRTRRLRGDMDAVRREAPVDGADPEARWQRALCDLALHQLADVDAHLALLRDGPPPLGAERAPGTGPPAPEPRAPAQPPDGGPLLGRVGSAEWDLLTDRAAWSGELYRILGRDPAASALTLDELPSLVHEDDRARLTAMVTGCLIDARPLDGEFRVLRPDGEERLVHMMGEPVLDAEGSTVSMWAVLRDVGELRRRRRTLRETHDSLHRRRGLPGSEHRVAAELREAVLPPWRGPLRLPRQGPGALDLAARCLPSRAGAPVGGGWYDALELPDGQTLLSVGELTGHGVAATTGVAMLLGAVRGMAVTGAPPDELLGRLNQLLDAALVPPALGGALCCRYRPAARTLSWARAGHPAPLLFRDGTGRALAAPDGVLLGATSGASYGAAEEPLRPGDLLLLHTGGLVPRHPGPEGTRRLLGLAERFGAARDAQSCVRAVVEEFGGAGRRDDACVLVARVTG
ncbi:PP2C family protein-serine/threonine phosphatase [Streptomyces griseoaurantiacus]|uniref:PP2C family protein-serine/threonine phosphatase n=1 Tax=Streptomyces griseoaurantiacus TaxID=68213 RepID=UPI0037B9507A